MSLVKELLLLYGVEFDEIEVNKNKIRIDNNTYFLNKGCSVLQIANHASLST